MTFSDRLIDKLLTTYIDEINEGKKPNVETYLMQCPKENRAELENLIETSLILKEYFVPSNLVEKERQDALNLVSELSKQRVENSPYKDVVNYRKKGDLSKEQEQKIRSKIDSLWEEIEDDEK